MRAKALLSHDVNTAVQKVLQVDEELGEVEKTPELFEKNLTGRSGRQLFSLPR
jgi:hypothetical protein